MLVKNKFILLSIIILNWNPQQLFAQELRGEKCGTFFTYTERLHQRKTNKTEEALSRVRPQNQISVHSPSGKFRIHFDTTGAQAAAMVDADGTPIPNTSFQFADTAAKIFDAVWKTEVTSFGFLPPPPDNNRGGGDEYDIYIIEKGQNTFGETWIEDDISLDPGKINPRSPTFIEIDNDFGVGFRTKGIAAVLATAAHEFHHAIQVGGYGVWNDDFYFYELSAESMESTVFPSSKDYLHDVKKYFNNIENISLYSPFSAATPGYERAIWGLYLIKKYNISLLRQIWEEVVNVKPLNAMINVFKNHSTSLGMEFVEFSSWNFYTGSRADTIRYYTDGKLFPPIAMNQDSLIGNYASVSFQKPCKTFSASYIQIKRSADTAFCIVANVNDNDANAAVVNSYVYTISATNTGGPPTNGLSLRFIVNDASNWKFTSLAKSNNYPENSATVFPNPFNPTKNSLYISYEDLSPTTLELSIYTSSYDLVYSNAPRTNYFFGKEYVVWNGTTNKGDVAASGVYYYVLSNGEKHFTGKFAVVR